METSHPGIEAIWGKHSRPTISDINRSIESKNYARAVAQCREYLVLIRDLKPAHEQDILDRRELASNCIFLGLAKEALEATQNVPFSSENYKREGELLDDATCRNALGDFKTAKKELLEADRIGTHRNCVAPLVESELYKAYMLEGDRKNTLRVADAWSPLMSDDNFYSELANLEQGKPEEAKLISASFFEMFARNQAMQALYLATLMKAKGYPECAKQFEDEVLRIQSMSGVPECKAERITEISM